MVTAAPPESVSATAVSQTPQSSVPSAAVPPPAADAKADDAEEDDAEEDDDEKSFDARASTKPRADLEKTEIEMSMSESMGRTVIEEDNFNASGTMPIPKPTEPINKAGGKKGDRRKDGAGPETYLVIQPRDVKQPDEIHRIRPERRSGTIMTSPKNSVKGAWRSSTRRARRHSTATWP